jgi:hypothetical protein
MSTQETAIIVACITALGTIATAIINKITLGRTMPDYKKDAEIDGFVSLLRHKYGAKRLSIFGYHNGGYWMDNTSISKFTCRHESCAIDETPLQKDMQNISTGMLKEMPAILSEKGFYVEININKRKNYTAYNPAYYEIMRQFGTNSTIGVGVFKKLFNWRQLKYSTEMVATIHLNWWDDMWALSLSHSGKELLELSNEITMLIKRFDKKAHLKVNLYEALHLEMKEQLILFSKYENHGNS